MVEYHVGCGLAGIYAGILKKNGYEWLHKSNVTDEAINAVIQYMYFQIPDDSNEFTYGVRMRDGKYVRLKVESSATCPEWAREILEGETCSEWAREILEAET